MYRWTAKAECDGLGHEGDIAAIVETARHPLAYYVLHGYAAEVSADEAAAVTSPEHHAAILAPENLAGAEESIT